MDRLLLFGLAILPFLAGCIPVPVGSEHPPVLVNQSTLDSMIGESKESILVSLGHPDASFASETSSYLIYGATGTEYQVFLLVWVPIAGDAVPGGKLFCVLLEFDEENIFSRYRINQHSVFWSDKSNVSDCASTFFAPEELKAFTPKDVVLKDFFVEKVLLERAGLGDPNAQWELYKRSKTRGEYKFKWLCKAAEQGDSRAQWELGYIYQRGLYGVRKDLVLSVMWFSLLEAEGHDSGGVDTIRKLLTPEQIDEAEHLYESWKPGQCEREIFGTEPNYSN